MFESLKKLKAKKCATNSGQWSQPTLPTNAFFSWLQYQSASKSPLLKANKICQAMLPLNPEDPKSVFLVFPGSHCTSPSIESLSLGMTVTRVHQDLPVSHAQKLVGYPLLLVVPKPLMLHWLMIIPMYIMIHICQIWYQYMHDYVHANNVLDYFFIYTAP